MIATHFSGISHEENYNFGLKSTERCSDDMDFFALWFYEMVGTAGIEPTHTESKSVVLPLYYAPTRVACEGIEPSTSA